MNPTLRIAVILCCLWLITLGLWIVQGKLIDGYQITVQVQRDHIADLQDRLLSASVDLDACNAELADLQAHPRLPALPGTETLGE